MELRRENDKIESQNGKGRLFDGIKDFFEKEISTSDAKKYSLIVAFVAAAFFIYEVAKLLL